MDQISLSSRSKTGNYLLKFGVSVQFIDLPLHQCCGNSHFHLNDHQLRRRSSIIVSTVRACSCVLAGAGLLAAGGGMGVLAAGFEKVSVKNLPEKVPEFLFWIFRNFSGYKIFYVSKICECWPSKKGAPHQAPSPIASSKISKPS
jgi:hypothetical protein